MNAVRMYTTQVCPYCVRAKALLKQRGVAQIEEIRIDLDPAQRDHMMETTGRRTVPQIFIGTSAAACCPCCRQPDPGAELASCRVLRRLTGT